MKNLFSNKWFWMAIAVVIIIFIAAKVRGSKKTQEQGGGTPSSEGKKAGDIITRVVGGVQKKYQVQPNGQVKDLETGQLVNLVGYKKVGAK